MSSTDVEVSIQGFRALADPVRWSIVRELRQGSRCACHLAEVADVPAPLLSHHLKVLRDAGIITGTRRGRWIDYTLNPEALAHLADAVDPRVGGPK